MEPYIGTGAIPSPPDHRDVSLTAALGAAGPLPSKYFVDVDKLPVWHQRKIGACVGHAAAKYKQLLDLLDTKKVRPLSARFLYAIAKARDGYQDEGTYPRLVASILKNEGCATEKTVVNDTTLSHEEYVYQRNEKNIPAEAWKDALKAKISGYAFVNLSDPTEMKRAIVEANGAILLLRLGKEWYTDKNGKSSWKSKDIVPIRPPKSVISGHEVYLYGYEEVGNRIKFHVFNSWSKDWANSGKAYFWYDEYKKWLDEAITFVDIPDKILEEIKEELPPDEYRHAFNTNLAYGETNEEVKELQKALKIDGVYTGPVTGYYGDQTAAGVLTFWQKYGLTSWFENITLAGRSVGPKTRAQLNKLFNK